MIKNHFQNTNVHIVKIAPAYYPEKPSGVHSTWKS